MKNIVYKSSSLVEYFASNRIKWEQFYESERKLLGALQLNSDQQVLDIGCGCGGLGLALKEKFGINNYTGVEINAYGYWGKPSITAVTPYEKLCFSAFSIRKRFSDEKNDIQLDLKISDDIKVSLEDF